MERDKIIKDLQSCYDCSCGVDCPFYDEDHCFHAMLGSGIALIKELTKENKRLKAQKYYLHSDGRIEMIPTVESVRADTVRKMQERLKAQAMTIKDHTGKMGTVVGVGNIDDVAREMFEE